MLLILLLAFEHPKIPECVIDRCEDNFCVVETPEGTVTIPKKSHYKEGLGVVCPLWMIDPT